jgi:hypothetical protein
MKIWWWLNKLAEIVHYTDNNCRLLTVYFLFYIVDCKKRGCLTQTKVFLSLSFLITFHFRNSLSTIQKCLVPGCKFIGAIPSSFLCACIGKSWGWQMRLLPTQLPHFPPICYSSKCNLPQSTYVSYPNETRSSKVLLNTLFNGLSDIRKRTAVFENHHDPPARPSDKGTNKMEIFMQCW